MVLKGPYSRIVRFVSDQSLPDENTAMFSFFVMKTREELFRFRQFGMVFVQMSAGSNKQVLYYHQQKKTFDIFVIFTRYF